MKTKSLWGNPPSRYYNFLKRVKLSQSKLKRPIKVCILGCSDGKFVLPAARFGFKVLAIDIDKIALYGGFKKGPLGEVYMEGLTSRLNKEGLTRLVRVVNTDFVEYDNSDERFDAVFTSGAINYSFNLKNKVGRIVEKVKSYVLPNGFIYFDYMLPFEEVHSSRENYFRKGALVRYFEDKKTWRVVYDKVLPPLMEKGHVDMPTDHYHHWGHLCVQRIK